jgi:hypothetical protein
VTAILARRGIQGAAAVLVAAFAIGAGGCAHTLGPAPSDAQLRNDGSDDARSYLYEKYRLEVRGGDVHRPWAADLVTEGDDAELDTYVARSDEAVAALATLPVALSRWSGSVAMPITLIAAGASVGAGIGLFAGLMALEPGGVLSAGIGSGAGQGAGRDAVWATLIGTGAGLVAAVPISLLAWWTLDAIASHAARGDLRRAVDAYNADLKGRIDAGYRPELVRPPRATPPPAVDKALPASRPSSTADDAAPVSDENAPAAADDR